MTTHNQQHWMVCRSANVLAGFIISQEKNGKGGKKLLTAFMQQTTATGFFLFTLVSDPTWCVLFCQVLWSITFKPFEHWFHRGYKGVCFVFQQLFERL